MGIFSVRAPQTPTGIIVAWAGALNAIPAGWTLCNGENGTPDLRGQFIIGAGGSYSVGANGGATSQSYTPAGTNSAPTFTGTPQTFTTGLIGLLAGDTMLEPNPYTPAGTVSAPTFTGENANISTLPPYYALCWIMKL